MIARRLLVGGIPSGLTPPEPPPLNPPEPFTMTSPPEGGLTAWALTQAMYVAANDETWISYVSGAGNLRVAVYDHATEATTVQALRGNWERDDHDPAGLVIRASDSRIVAGYSKHNSSDVRRRISTNVLDPSAWGTEASLDTSFGGSRYTYNKLHQLTDVTGDPIHWYYRDEPTAGDDSRWCRSISTNEGSTWGAQTVIFRQFSERSYLTTWADGRYVHFLTSNGKLGALGKLGHFYYDGVNDTFHLSDGTTLGPLHFDIDDTTIVLSGVAANPLYVHIDGSGNPHFSAVALVGSEFRYYAGRWTGSAWRVVDVASGGAGYPYSSPTGLASYGCTLDDGDLDTLYTLEEVGTAKSELFVYTTSDSGVTWDGPDQLTTGSNILQTRITPVRNRSDVPVVWTYGTLSSMTSWNMGLRGFRV